MGRSNSRLCWRVGCKPLANSERWNDDNTFNRDVLDLAHLPISESLLKGAIAKAEDAYGNAIRVDLAKALGRLLDLASGLSLWTRSLGCSAKA